MDNRRRNMRWSSSSPCWNAAFLIFLLVSYSHDWYYNPSSSNANAALFCHGLSVAATPQNNNNNIRQSSSSYSPPPKPIPITVISGFLGSGKTSLLKHLLENKQGLRIGVIVNDLASVNIDSKLLAASSSSSPFGMSSSSSSKKNGIMMLELQNGCACCSRSEELLASVAELVTLSDMRSSNGGDSDEQCFQHIVIEMSGVADPKGIRSKFQEAQLYDMPLMERVRLDTMVTLIDVSTFLQYLKSAQIATPLDAPELYYNQQQEEEEEEQKVNDDYYAADLDDLAYLELVEQSMMSSTASANNLPRAYGESVASLLVSQTETADVILLNKIDLLSSSKNDDDKDGGETDNEDDDGVLTKTRDIVAALNPRARIFATRFGQLPENNPITESVLAAARGQGVVMAGVVDDHRDAVQAVVDKMMMSNTAASATHSHSHEHAATAEAPSCNDPDCTDTSTSHSHSHDHQPQTNQPHSTAVCTSPDCTDASHSHSHDHQQNDSTVAAATSTLHAGIGSFVYRARRPFHPHRLFHFLQNLPVTRGLEQGKGTLWNENKNDVKKHNTSDLKLSAETVETMQNVIRSKGFVWIADSNRIASFWSHAGTSFELQQLGSWWATLPRNQWPPESIPTILVDFDDVNHSEDDENYTNGNSSGSSSSRASVGDRRQEVVLIGPCLADPVKQRLIHQALEQCLLTDTEWNLFNKIQFSEQELAKTFPNPIAASVSTY